eukprot:TRINITY_DN67449_c0_g1_i1.p2 TRINITY_DN67449_c0_g1~~TRINITY_DN67449_c0_g1_i1.p2  ORF type:complete len:105 (+),score=0.65 TRINITY_DN67449_c0_g1_i1:35-316(+)
MMGILSRLQGYHEAFSGIQDISQSPKKLSKILWQFKKNSARQNLQDFCPIMPTYFNLTKVLNQKFFVLRFFVVVVTVVLVCWRGILLLIINHS